MANDVVIIGAGAAGLICAGTAAKRGLDVILLERNERPARKVMITGKGRCNLTNACSLQDFIASVPRNGRFLYSAYNSFTPYDVMELIESLGVQTKIERGNRVFPVSDKAVAIVDALVRYATENGVKIKRGRATAIVSENCAVSHVLTDNGETIDCKAAVIATGGLSYPATGSDGDGYKLAKALGHNVTPLVPSLVPLCVHEGYAAQLQGLSLKNVSLRLFDSITGKVIFTDFGEMMFTHFGVTGPMILSASSHIREMESERYKIYIDMKPALDEKTLDLRLLRDFSDNSNRDYINSLDMLLPKKMVPVIVRLSGIDAHCKVNQITREQREKLCILLKNLPLTVTDFRPIDEAVITSGGVDIREIDPKTMQSKLIDNLHFAGEVIDVDGYTGGFNLQIAFSTGFVAGSKVLGDIL